MKLFEPDFFSSINFTPSKDFPITDPEITNFFNSRYSNKGKIKSISKLSGLNINSDNYKLTTDSGEYLLKYWKFSNVARINEICFILKSLNQMNLLVPFPLPSKSGSYFESFNDKYITLFNFIKGEFFSPQELDLPKYFESVNELFQGLGKIKTTKSPKKDLPDFKIMIKTVNQLFKSQASLIQKFEKEFQELDKILPKLKYDSEYFRGSSRKFISQYCHNDLHPRNVLKVSVNNFAFLDFDACEVSDPNVSWGFTLLKTLREVISSSNESIDPVNLGIKVIQDISKLAYSSKLDVDHLPIYGRMEIMRRLVYIINDFQSNEYSVWLDMLPVQIKLLRESYVIFATN